MNNIDQKTVDFLYEQIVGQQLRCDYFDRIGNIAPNSVWNKTSDERAILQMFVNNYKRYYLDKAEEIKKKLEEIKEYDISSYLTYDTEYYVNKYNSRMEEVNRYIVEVNAKDTESVLKDKLGFISDEISLLFPDIMTDPILIGKFSE